MKIKLFLGFALFMAFSVVSAQTTVRGKITDENGEALIGATVVLKSNRAIGTVADLDGMYTLKISGNNPETIIAIYIGYKSTEALIQPDHGKIIIKDFILISEAKLMSGVEIKAKTVKTTDTYMEKVKMKSAVSIDYISSATIKKTGDNNVIAAVSRVTGVSTNGNFITVRGIGDRYVKTTINGCLIPTLDAFTNNIKLDLFPAALVDNIVISKTASPDLPGDWSGAYLSVETKDYPEKFTVSFESTLGYNNQSTFQNVVSSQHSSTDWLGYDNGFRALNQGDFSSANINPTPYVEFVALGLGEYFKNLGIRGDNWNETYYKLSLVQFGLLQPALINDPQAVQNAKNQFELPSCANYIQAFNTINAGAAKFGQSLPNNWNTTTIKAPLNFSQSFTIGNQIQLFGRALGFIAGFRYGRSIQNDPNSVANRTDVDVTGQMVMKQSATQEVTKENNGWSALINLAYKFNANHSVSLLFMPNLAGVNNVRNSTDTVGQNAGGVDQNGLTINKSQFYEQRKQLVYQYKSAHFFPSIKLKVDIDASYTKGNSSAPDFKELLYTAKSNGDAQVEGVHRYYRYLSENLFDSHLSAEIPLDNVPGLTRKFKFGGSYQLNDRTFDQYDYGLNFGPGSTGKFDANHLSDFFSLNNFGVGSFTVDGITYPTMMEYYIESNLPSNHTMGHSEIAAGFLMLDYSINKDLRVSGGIRAEQAQLYTDVAQYDFMHLAPNDPRRQHVGEIFIVNPGELNHVNVLPSISLIYKLKNDEAAPLNLRLNYSKSVARPSLRELYDGMVYDYELRANVFGNSGLKMVHIDNYDVRLESYFKTGDELSFSLFYKQFTNHIELVKTDQYYTWQNADNSRALGIEVEGKKVLGKHFEFRANVSVINSMTNFVQTRLEVNSGTKVFIPIDTVQRTMFGQAPYVVNGIFAYTSDSLGLSVTLSYNVQGPRLVLTSTNGTPDIYELPRNLLDLKVIKKIGKYFSASFNVKDILNSPIRRSYKYPDGWNIDYDRYTYGTNFLVSLAVKI
ncbi:MAG: carboxypeptidase-like regulatory domain-containing protein [Bacteroidota bacterium]